MLFSLGIPTRGIASAEASSNRSWRRVKTWRIARLKKGEEEKDGEAVAHGT